MLKSSEEIRHIFFSFATRGGGNMFSRETISFVWIFSRFLKISQCLAEYITKELKHNYIEIRIFLQNYFRPYLMHVMYWWRHSSNPHFTWVTLLKFSKRTFAILCYISGYPIDKLVFQSGLKFSNFKRQLTLKVYS